MRLTKSFIGFMALPMIFFLGCNKECADCPQPLPSADVTKPTISVVKPGNDAQFMSGDTIAFHAWFNDNRELGQYKIDIHSADDGHSHGKPSGEINFFEYSKIVTLSGVQSEQKVFIPIPVTAAAGKYHFIVSALDKAGNEAEFKEVDIYFTNPSDTVAPLVTPTYPNFSATEVYMEMPSGKDTLQLRLLGQLTDASNGGSAGNLKSYSIYYQKEGSDLPLYSMANYNLNGPLFNMDIPLILRREDIVSEAYYDLEIRATDYQNNATSKQVKVKVVLK
jgi:hypothetical protein